LSESLTTDITPERFPNSLNSIVSWIPRQHKDKVDKVKEWDALPLQSTEDLETWFRTKVGEQGDSPDVQAAGQDSSIMGESTLAAPDSHYSRPGIDHSPVPESSTAASRDVASSSMPPKLHSTLGQPEQSQSKAKKLLESRKDLYF
jgi:hypothetical protein